MKLRGFSPRTQDSYVDAVAGLAKFFNRSPDKLSKENVQAYLLYQVSIQSRYGGIAQGQVELCEIPSPGEGDPDKIGINHPDDIGTGIHTLSILRIALKLHFVQKFVA